MHNFIKLKIVLYIPKYSIIIKCLIFVIFLALLLLKYINFIITNRFEL